MLERLACVRDQALEVGRGWSGSNAPPSWRLTAALFNGLADDRTLLELAGGIPGERLLPLLFVASVHYLMGRHPDEEFSAYFPVPGSDQPALDSRFTERYLGSISTIETSSNVFGTGTRVRELVAEAAARSRAPETAPRRVLLGRHRVGSDVDRSR